MKHELIIWDWNGTLLDDTARCVETVNSMLSKRGLPTLTVQAYREVFDFPVAEYYLKIGFDFAREPFDSLAVEYIEKYNSAMEFCALQKDAVEVLKHFRDAGTKQIVLSACEQGLLEKQIADYRLTGYFDALVGQKDIYAGGKLGAAQDYFAGGISDALLIGDTTHDYEVARALNADCRLVANGHHSRERLQKCGVPVYESLLGCIE